MPRVWIFGFRSLGFVSDFEIRIFQSGNAHGSVGLGVNSVRRPALSLGLVLQDFVGLVSVIVNVVVAGIHAQ